MKRLFTLCAIVVAVVVSSCSKFDDTDIWDKLNDHESRITALEELCKQMNTNITALQTIVEALEKNDYITNVSPVRKDGEIIGYTITFAHSDTITIYHGENGVDGYVPNISVMKDMDGIYYWTIDGEWLLDGKGNKIQANGVDGANGDNGITPRLKIEDDYWYVSYDNGVTWTEVGKAIDKPTNSCPIIQVQVTENEVILTLVDGTNIAIPYGGNKDYIDFLDNTVELLCVLNWDTNKDNYLSYAEAAAVDSIGDVFRGSNIVSFKEFRYFTSLTHIDEYAFYECKLLREISLPISVRSIGLCAFGYCGSITNVFIDNVEQWCNIEFESWESNPISYGANLYVKNELMIDLIIPDTVTTIKQYAFYSGNFNSITIGNSVTSIENSAFSGCNNIENIVIPDQVLKIGVYSFDNCERLKSVTIGKNVSIIENFAFGWCDNLTTIYCKPTIPPSISAIYRSSAGNYYWEGTFPFNEYRLIIFVPVEAYNDYTQYPYTTGSQSCKQANWYAYKNYIATDVFE